MSLLGLDLNATRARAVSGPPGDFPLPVPLDPPALELPLVVSVERAVPQVGHVGLRLRRLSPHLICHNFLPYLPHSGDATGVPVPDSFSPFGEEADLRTRCRAGAPPVDSRQALDTVWQRLRPLCAASQVMVLSLPAYLIRAQIEVALALGRRAGVSPLGIVPAPLATALAAHAE